MYLVDSCVWIDFLRGRTNPRTELLEALLVDGGAYINEVILMEVCSGARDPKQFAKYMKYFEALPFLTLTPGWSHKVALLIFEARRKGLKIFTADAMIAHQAIEHRMPILTSDKDFSYLSEHFEFTVS